ncbi:hypothetical protein [Candidatus Sneabacter namystus]|uniref:Uncharacterized protein n=1 Tax=Candidatus Sneabacter namystus TaxID=2601646 RepID=A0A5C0UIR5_9RICK|nr:hypothetical protein [Candidatus Sneabacter namystus]QEK39403.1 hypothetical protein FZC37_00395 [Candidatus Sneabacter namystus]
MDIKLNTEELILGIDDEEQGCASTLKARNRDKDRDRDRDRDKDKDQDKDDEGGVFCSNNNTAGAIDMDFGQDEELLG